MFRSILLGVIWFLSAAGVGAEVLTYQCVFEYRIDNEGRSDELMPLEFKVDTLNRRSFMEGNAGIVDVDIHIGDNSFSFTEKLLAGAI